MKELKYDKLPENIIKQIKEDKEKNKVNPYAFKDKDIIRREDLTKDRATLWRPAFIHDIEKIMNCPYYNRYADKTQVFSFRSNDDISRRAIHVQFVSRIARNIGRVLGLNLDLIEAIALGHDLGHTPFGHAGERFLNELYYKETGRYFNHNVHSVRVLDKIMPRNVSLQVLDGILSHNGEKVQKEYKPIKLDSFEEFDKKVENCYVNKKAIGKLVPNTLEGCIVRISDMIAYVGKDRQDAKKLGVINSEEDFPSKNLIGNVNAQIINNISINIIKNSYGKDYITIDEDYFKELEIIKEENYKKIYDSPEVKDEYNQTIAPMFNKVYYKLLDDLNKEKRDSIIYKHHINYVNKNNEYYNIKQIYEKNEKHDIVVDFIASMTDDYFIDLYNKIFGVGTNQIKKIGYFD